VCERENQSNILILQRTAVYSKILLNPRIYLSLNLLKTVVKKSAGENVAKIPQLILCHIILYASSCQVAQ
jgi:hypothetical protein